MLRFFDGLEWVEPGLVVPHRWHPDAEEREAEATDADVSIYAGVARKP
ncbi:SAM-dependent methyltransferase [Streptomyces sp. M19]